MPAATNSDACCPALTSSTCLLRTSDKEVPRSIARINVSQKRRIVGEFTCAPKTSKDCERLFPFFKSIKAPANFSAISPLARLETLNNAVEGLSPAETRTAKSSTIEGNSDSAACNCFFWFLELTPFSQYRKISRVDVSRRMVTNEAPTKKRIAIAMLNAMNTF